MFGKGVGKKGEEKLLSDRLFIVGKTAHTEISPLPCGPDFGETAKLVILASPSSLIGHCFNSSHMYIGSKSALQNDKRAKNMQCHKLLTAICFK